MYIQKKIFGIRTPIGKINSQYIVFAMQFGISNIITVMENDFSAFFFFFFRYNIISYIEYIYIYNFNCIIFTSNYNIITPKNEHKLTGRFNENIFVD